jgi:hypothetical protein
MHYADGSEAHAGDLVLQRVKTTGIELLGILMSATADSTSCNGQMLGLARRAVSDAGETGWIPYNYPYDLMVTVGELFPIIKNIHSDS